jgi:3-oxoacyl-[acyl-carrier protein] reductase
MRNALVTGAARGIGLAITKLFLRNGYAVYANYRKMTEELEELVSNFPDTLNLLQFDLAKEESTIQAIAKLDGVVIDVLINNAGVLKDNLLAAVEEEDWNWILDVNFWSLCGLYEKVCKNISLSSRPVVINMGSISGVKPRAGQGAYAVSKAMVIEWTKQMANNGEGIAFYSVSPGPVATDMIKKAPWYTRPDAFSRIPMKRFAEPEEIANCFLFLDDEKCYVKNGSNIVIDGGFTQTVKDA